MSLGVGLIVVCALLALVIVVIVVAGLFGEYER